ncbi:YrhK family protein [Leucobacter sp. NPDC077196]|uniref:YrhK family protein n=1 Tax=Leucobacter sp. NPDC077196 TaxID=3154959 RepID=UPI0034139B00
MASDTSSDDRAHDIEVALGSNELVIRNRYQVLSFVNDIGIGVLFVVGSLLFLREATSLIGTWFFVFGSVQLLIKPGIRLSRHVHLKRFDTERQRKRIFDE